MTGRQLKLETAKRKTAALQKIMLLINAQQTRHATNEVADACGRTSRAVQLKCIALTQ